VPASNRSVPIKIPGLLKKVPSDRINKAPFVPINKELFDQQKKERSGPINKELLNLIGKVR
jgi:hypothetical protein